VAFENKLNIRLQPLTLAQLALAVTVALLLILIVGAVVGLVAWPLLMFVYGRANQALGIASFAINMASGLLAFSLLRVLAKTYGRVASPAVLERNA